MEIKCRGYDRDTKRWYYGGYFKHQIKEICPVQFSDETAADKEPKYEHYIVFDGFADWNMAKPIKLATVDSKSVGVYIGRKDAKSDETIAHGAAFEYSEIVGNTYENIDLLA